MKNTNIINIKKRIGENLFKIRRERNLSIQQVSTLSGIPKSRIDWAERGKGCLNLSKLIQYANFYNIDVKNLL